VFVHEREEIRFIDLFGGVGGFRLGLERANQISVNAQQRAGDEKRQCEPCHEGGGGRNRWAINGGCAQRDKDKVVYGIQWAIWVPVSI
jgi:hypothetical protein